MKFSTKVLSSVLISGLAFAQAPHSYKDISFKSSDWTAPKAEKYRQLIDGHVSYLIPDSSLPIIRLHLLFKASGIPKDSNLLAAKELLGNLLIQGGTQNLTGAQIDDSLEFVAAKMSAQPGNFTSSVQLECLTKDFPELLVLLKEALLKPGFDPKVLSEMKLSAKENWQHRFDKPTQIAAKLNEKVIYGKHSQTWRATDREINQLSNSDLHKIIGAFFNPQGMVIGVTGQFNTQEMTNTLSKWLQSWQLPANQFQNQSPALPRLNPGLFVVDYPSNQSQVILSAPFIQRPHPDYFPTAVASYILAGGGFGSRLVDHIRSDEGLAYHVGSSAGNSYFQVATTGINLQTKAPSTVRALQIIWRDVQDFIKTGPDSSELANAKKSLIQSLPASFDNAENTMDALMSNEIYGRPLDYYAKFASEIESITAEQVRLAAQKYFDPKRMSVSLVGPWKTILANDSMGFLKQFKLQHIKIKDLDSRDNLMNQ